MKNKKTNSKKIFLTLAMFLLTVTITVQTGGKLVIDGGVVTNTAINLAQGSQLRITNGGKLVMRTNTDFEAPSGAVVEIEQGEIIGSNDF